MNQPDFEAAKQYALSRLENELAPDLFYHSLAHTKDHVLPAVIRLATMMNISQEERNLLEVAASYHDIGFLMQREEHEQIGSDMAKQILPRFDFTPTQIEQIVAIIMATRVPQTPHNLLQEIMADADLDVLGRKQDFWSRNQHLRAELAAYGEVVTDTEWYSRQLFFLQSHDYFTCAAQALRHAGKEKHIAQLKQRLKEAKAS